MKCDELKAEPMIINDDYAALYYPKDSVDAAIAELKAIVTTDNSAVIARLEEQLRKTQRALWLARAKEAWSNARWFNLCNPYYVRNRQGFTPDNENQKQMDSIEWARLFYNNYKKLIAKAKEYK